MTVKDYIYLQKIVHTEKIQTVQSGGSQQKGAGSQL